MSTWPNWVDVFIATLLLRTCYKGISHGLVWELLHLLRAVALVAFSATVTERLLLWVQPWIATISAEWLHVLVFWVVWVLAVLLTNIVLRYLTSVIKWERPYWFTQGMGLILGALRGAWWSTLILIALSSSGFDYLKDSAEEHSLIGAQWGSSAREGVAWVLQHTPGASFQGRDVTLPIWPTHPS